MIKTTGTFDACFDGDVMTVSLFGEIDHHNASTVRTGIDKLIYEKRPQKLVLDLKAIDFMDSSGLGLIMGRYSLIREMGGEMSLRDPGKSVLRICKLAGLERMIRIERTPNDGKQ